ncbi:hypothetical protein QWI17_22785 [Gilvimarinus sp. SDUM040013]|uniref:Uncharacterized protein n=1 Tax=Gilvimarinus gilvus TaxID=3058038 RepID=A0ABU4RXH0_9GAMM|nr:hypothetical protein [Gilvimarinus sp. SDUM040013]MDO3388691.1 hypothetical protein [Gilvimarinus sp. SDUM040013]MDX6849586.1 hypothetical protein [Gilvimarinus sp. SDUM040013]
MLLQWISRWRAPKTISFTSEEQILNNKPNTYSSKLPEYQRVQACACHSKEGLTPLVWMDQPLFAGKPIVIESQGISGSTQGMRDVWVSLRNQGKQAMQLEARAMFYDQAKRPINSKAPWKKVTVPGNASSLYFKSSQSSQVEYVAVEFRQNEQS